MNSLEKGLNTVEHTLSMCAAYTVIVPVFGAIKTKLGVIQLTIAIASLIFTAAYGSLTNDWKPYEHSIEHILHGARNIAAGFFESIPVFQTVINLSYFKSGVNFTNEQKSIPYSSMDGGKFMKSLKEPSVTVVYNHS